MVTKTTSIALGPELADFARSKVESGEFGSTSEVVRAAMRRFITYDKKLQALRRAIQEGEDSGPPQPFDFEEFIAEMRAKSKDAA